MIYFLKEKASLLALYHFRGLSCKIKKWLDHKDPIADIRGKMQAQGPEEMCLSLENQNPLKTSEKMGYFERVTVSLHIL